MSDLVKIAESMDDLAQKWEVYQKKNDERLAVIEKKGFEPADFKEEFAKMDTAMDAAQEMHGKLVTEFKEALERVDTLETAIRRPGTGEGGGKWSLPEHAEHKQLLDQWLRSGVEPPKLKELETKVLRTSSDPDGGYALTPEREAGILERARETSPMRQVANVISIQGDTWEKMRIVSHATGGGWVSEQGTRSTTTTPTFGLVSIVAHEQYEQPAVTQKMLDDAGFQVETYLGDEVAAAMNLRENTAWITGTGVGQPRGIMTYTSGSDDTAFQVEQVASGHASQVTADGFIDTQDTLFEAYQANAKWLMPRATRSLARKLKDGQGQYLLNVDFSAGGAATILGKEVVLCSDIAAVTGSALAVAYGDFRMAYNIVDRIGIRVLRDPYSSKPNVLFYTTKRTGGGVVKPQAYKIMVIGT